MIRMQPSTHSAVAVGAEATLGVKSVMTTSNNFANVRIESGGSVRGPDEMGHDLFKITRAIGPDLYGDYFYVGPEDGNDFDIEVGLFGYTNPHDAGALNPSFREHFSAEDASAAEQLIRSYFLSNPAIFRERFLMPPARFQGGVSFRPNWILQKPPKSK
jgi:hypothetical protein